MVKTLSFLASFLLSSVSLADSGISINNLKAAIEMELNATEVTFKKAYLDKLKDRYLAWGSQLEFQFLREGNPLKAECKLKKNEVGLFMKCKTYDKKGKRTTLFAKGEFSNLSKVLTGMIPIIPHEKVNNPEAKRSESDHAS
ncbi:MAG: hypothetical protein A4S09_06735 [Proteobacteria bacterium SG_bin7]|nr:MAG: hypothetical protein A4S09_06735 [Proteobacteria bacterium SG_bin7]